MPKGINQKLKLLYIIQILEQMTDENHPMTAKQIIEQLEEYNIYAERKSIYDDINQLIDFGYDINLYKAKVGGGYYIGQRRFQLSELKLLVDSVQASRFISRKKSRELISKLEKMTSIHEETLLKRDVYVQNRIKTDNESIYYIVNDIHNAMQHNKQISFLYMEWTIQKKLVAKHDGEKYVISPFALTIKDENYYLIAYDDKADIIKHYRVDKIKNLSILDSDRKGNERFKEFDVAKYANKSFGMYGGDSKLVTLKFLNGYIGVILDRFGSEVDIRKLDDTYASTKVEVAISDQFFGWIASVGRGISIAAPVDVVKQYKAFLDRLSSTVNIDD